MSAEVLQALRGFVREVVREEINRALEEREPTEASTEWLSLRAAGAVAGVHPDTVARWVREGRIKAGTAGRHVRIRRADLELLITSGGRGKRAATKLSPEAQADLDFPRNRRTR